MSLHHRPSQSSAPPAPQDEGDISPGAEGFSSYFDTPDNREGGESGAQRVGARGAFDSPYPYGSIHIAEPLTPTGTHLAAPRNPMETEGDGFAYPGSGGGVKRARADDDGQGQSKTARTQGNGERTSILRDRQLDAFKESTVGLPAEKGFPIQIGSELFRLSGASIMSDAPSYFSRFFEECLRQPGNDGGVVKTLYIDRDPATFQDIALHLQGYFVKPRDGMHYVRLFMDAQFYSLPKLIKQLFEADFCIRIGEREFQLPRELFTGPGNNPNYFTLGFTLFGSDRHTIFAGLERENLFRPPSIDPPALLLRSADTFADILALLRGYPLKIRDSEHRRALLSDCRYYHFRGLEQALLPCLRSYNIARDRHEILMRLEDIRQSGLGFAVAASKDDIPPHADGTPAAIGSGWVQYARPFVDDAGAAELIVEIGGGSARLSMVRGVGRLTLLGKARARVTSLLNIVASKMELPGAAALKASKSGLNSGGAGGSAATAGTGGAGAATSGNAAGRPGGGDGPSSTVLSDLDALRAHVGCAAHIDLDGQPFDLGTLGDKGLAQYLDGQEARWAIRRAHLRLCIRPRQSQPPPDKAARVLMEVVCVVNKLEAFSEDGNGPRAENREREWMGWD